MGWRSDDIREADAERWRKSLPWRERYNWSGMVIFAAVLIACGIYLWHG
jgi:uncharacterized membrane protein